ncbi:MAG: UDP-N-acetylmuramoyl-L-alanine--D-glutamate ligase [Rickettsiales bacterium]|jgi:UDP-N-acetylmuramoylalanine--D-glutamate ligase|nr:UDP-N-acetylmuramoyl-L-alanine--D-glutamate ligase [Rickettsiales bacterium]
MASKLQNKKLYFLGLGASNISAAKNLSQTNEIFVYDDKISELADFNFIHYNDIDFSSIDYLVATPAIPTTYPKPHPAIKLALKHNVKIIGDIELYFMQFNRLPKIIAITGTNGKSTTTSLIYHLLSQTLSNKIYVGGNIGTSVFEIPIDESAYYVIEMSSFQLELLSELEFDYSVLLNITPDHLDRHKDLEGYVKAKMRIFYKKKLNNIAIICSDSPIAYNIFDSLENQKIKYNSDEIKEGDKGLYYKSFLILNNLLELKKFSNPQNLIAALIIAEMEGVDLSLVQPIIEKFKPLEHRFEKVITYDNITIYNDSKATNAESTENALKQLDNIYWIAGGIPKDGGIIGLEKYFSKIKKIYLFGEAADLFQRQINGKVETAIFDQDFKRLVITSIADAKADVDQINILFSPSCSSFDMFANYAARGTEFKKLIEDYLKC